MVVLAGLPLAVYLDARSDIASELRQVELEIAEERARLEHVRLPCLRGEPIDEPGRARMLAVAEPRGSFEDGRIDVKQSGLGAPLAPAERAELERHRSGLEALHDALRCTRVTPPSFKAGELGVPLGYEHLQRLLALEANERAAKRDARGAVECHLDVARLGLAVLREGDGESAPLESAFVGAWIQAEACRALGVLVATVSMEESLLAQIARELDVLDAAAPRADEIWAHHGLVRRRELCAKEGELSGLDGTGCTDAAGHVLVTGWKRALPRSLLVARAIRDFRAILDEHRPSRVSLRRSALDDQLNALPGRFAGPKNPLTLAFLCASTRSAPIVQDFHESEVHEALLRGALLMERGPAGVSPPRDPWSLTGEPLRYEAGDGRRRWKLWSVGKNGRDEGGAPRQVKDSDDVVLECWPR